MAMRYNGINHWCNSKGYVLKIQFKGTVISHNLLDDNYWCYVWVTDITAHKFYNAPHKIEMVKK